MTMTTSQSEQDRVVAMVLDKLMSALLDRSLGHTLRQNEMKFGDDAPVVKLARLFFTKTYGDDEYGRLLSLPELTDDEKVWYDAHRRSMTAAVIAGEADGAFADGYMKFAKHVDLVLTEPKPLKGSLSNE